MRFFRPTVGIAALVVALAGLGVAAASASAVAVPRTSFVTAYSSPGDWLGDGLSYLWSSAASDGIRVVPTKPATVSVDIEALSASSGLNSYFLSEPPTGRQLTRGVYTDTGRGPTKTRAGLDVSFGDRGCDAESGRFDILDIGPHKSRLRALYQDSCDGGPAIFGEISLNEPASPKSVIVASDRIVWPTLLPGRTGRAVPLAVANPSNYATRFTTVSITKGSPYFRVTHNGCGLVRPHSACVVAVRFSPMTTGEHEGLLTLHGTRGIFTADLAGYGLYGHTDWTMTSDRADAVGLGRRYSFTQHTSTVAASASNGDVRITAVADDAKAFTAVFGGIPNHPLVTGQHFHRTLTTSGPDQPDPVLDVQGEGRACDTTQGVFSVLRATYGFGVVERFDVTFAQHCGTSAAALTGKIDYEVLPAPAAAPTWAGLTR